MEQDRHARQWGACITPIASFVTPVVGNLFLALLAPWTALHLSPRQMDHQLWPRLKCGGGWVMAPFSLGLACLRSLSPGKICWPPGERCGAREEPFASHRERLPLWPWALESSSSAGYWSLLAAWTPCLLPLYRANTSYPCNCFFIWILHTV